jgi:hypothetical protein
VKLVIICKRNILYGKESYHIYFIFFNFSVYEEEVNTGQFQRIEGNCHCIGHAWYGGNVEGLGYIEADTDVYGVYGVTNTSSYGNSTITTSYYSSSGDYSRSRNDAWYDYIAEKIIDKIPFLGSGLGLYKDYYDRKINNAIGTLLDKGYSGSIIVDVIYGSPSSSTDVSIRLKIYGGDGTLFHDSY